MLKINVNTDSACFLNIYGVKTDTQIPDSKRMLLIEKELSFRVCLNQQFPEILDFLGI